MHLQTWFITIAVFIAKFCCLEEANQNLKNSPHKILQLLIRYGKCSTMSNIDFQKCLLLLYKCIQCICRQLYQSYMVNMILAVHGNNCNIITEKIINACLFS